MKGQCPIGFWFDGAIARRHRDVGGVKLQWCRAERVGKLHAQPLSTDGNVHDLAQRGVGQARSRRQIVRFGQLL